MNEWQFWIDRGGTFTDIVARQADGSIQVRKVLSSGLDEDAVVQGIREILNLPADLPLPQDQISVVKLGTTVATNALLERQGVRTALVITKGFGDALRIGYQNRPDIFALQILQPELLYEQVLEVSERNSASGEELEPVDSETVRQGLQQLYDQGIRSCAIILMHGYRYPAHEQQIGAIAQAVGFTQISMSHAVSPLIKLISRGDTTVVDAYLSPVLHRYLDRLIQTLGQTQLLVMQSNGGLVEATQIQGKDAVLSGPAGGVVGAVKVCAAAGIQELIGFDMGGTSTDVFHYSGEYERDFETEVAGVRLRTPMMAIHTVAAGGGSILVFDGVKFRVGPESAGADPGPACYRQNGPLTVTDCNVLLGKIQPQYFPAVFGPDHQQPIDREVVIQKFADLTQTIGQATGMQATGQVQTPEQIAEGFLTIAVENMANAIQKISLQRGYDLSRYTLCCFGSAGGQHACAIAQRLGLQEILIHPFAGVLSAYGMGLAELRVCRQQSINGPLSEAEQLCDQLTQLETEAVEALTRQGVDPVTCQIVRKAYVRLQGTDTVLGVEWSSATVMERAFRERYYRLYGFKVSENLDNTADNTVSAAATAIPKFVIDSLWVEAVGGATAKTMDSITSPAISSPVSSPPPTPIEQVPMYVQGVWHQVPVFERLTLAAKTVIAGPALIIEPTGTNVIDPHWQAEITEQGNLRLQLIASATPLRVQSSRAPDPMLLEILSNQFQAIAEQMGVTLQNTSASVNIRERLDFSCAVFDGAGQLVANAPHIPVHLGSMGDSVQSVIQAYGLQMQPGDAYVLNDPYCGGTHLPDITVVTPVFIADRQPSFYVASRGHHADIGGITPGSMPPFSTQIDQEGILIRPRPLVVQGQFQTQAILTVLNSGPYPARNPQQNLADLQAQVAANQKGSLELQQMVERYGLQTVQDYMQHVQDYAELSVRRVIDRLQPGHFVYPMDDGCQIEVHIALNPNQHSACIDFTGTSPQQVSNFNAPVAVTKATVLYVFRTLVPEAIPLNAGCLKPLEILIPEDCLLNPRYPAAVVAGNVETSQAIANALYGALGVMAGSQGTMNNLTFGTDQYQYYETLCGGAGAGPNFHGADAVQTHMTNSRLTDPEVLEDRFPVLIREFSIRQNSGGAGQFYGGNGVVRCLQFQESMRVSVLSSHRKVKPFGIDGGFPGEVGHNSLKRTYDKTTRTLSGRFTVTVQSGDCLTIQTPGGGGYGLYKKSNLLTKTFVKF